MDQITLNVERRDDRGTATSKRLRRTGHIPGVVYGLGRDTVAITVPSRELQHLLSKAGAHAIINVVLEGGTEMTMTKELQRHPVRGDLVHVDFVRVRADQVVTTDVPVHLTGEPIGAKSGGVIEHVLFAVSISAKPGDLPQFLEVDVSALEIGDHIVIGDLPLPAGVEVNGELDEVVALVGAPRVAEEAPEVEAVEGEPGSAEARAEGTSEGAGESAGEG